MSGNVTNIFISYGRADSRALAIQLRDDLQAVGYSVWLDLADIPGGSSWSQDIEEAIEYSHVVLALMSPASYQSKWCRAEQLRAIRKGKRLVPLLSIKDAEIPLHLEHMNYLDFTDDDRYNAMFRDLLSDITAGSAFRPVTQGSGGMMTMPEAASPYTPRAMGARRGYQDEKRTAPQFRQHLRSLRSENWLGARFWWPYFLFYFTDIYDVANILTQGEVTSAFAQGDDLNSRFDRHVRLYFRPRTPDLFYAEGFRPALNVTSNRYAPMPVYLLFDMEAVICHPDSRFSEGNPDKTGKTYKTPSYFRDLPFEQIYHDSWFMPDEREEIMRCREAQVIIPDRITLESLQVIWMRSPAEYDTLRHLLPDDVWRQWRDKLTARSDYHLFNNKRPYVQGATLEEKQVRLRFNACQQATDCEPFVASAVIEYADGERIEWQEEAFKPEGDFVLELPKSGDYNIQLLFDGDIAYMGDYQPQLEVL